MAEGSSSKWGNVSVEDRALVSQWCSEHPGAVQWGGCRREPSGPGHVGVYLILAAGTAEQARPWLGESFRSRQVEHHEALRIFHHLVSTEGELLTQYRLRKADLIEVWPAAEPGGLAGS
jgi:hypothetical protein